MADVTGFLVKLSEDADLLESFRKDPSGVMKAHGIPDDAQKAILSKDPARIRAVMGDATVAAGIAVVIVLIL